MEFFGIEIKAKPKAGKAAAVAYETQYSTQNGTILDGKQIARNNATYSKMFRINTDIRRCVKEISETSVKSGYQIKQVLLTDGREKDVTVPEFEAALKASGGFKKIKGEIIKNLSIFGNAFIRKHNNVRKQGVKYSVLDSRYVAIITDSELNVLRYQYNPPFKRTGVETFMPEEIMHVMETVDMDNPAFGMTIMETLVLDVMGDEEASLSNYHFFGNDSIPSALFVLKEGLTAEQQKDQFEKIKETLQGGHNKHKNIVSGAIQDVKPIRQQHTDSGFTEQRKEARDKICAGFGVPKTILGYVEDVNHSNGESQYEKFIENTIRPWEGLIAEIFTELVQAYNKAYAFRVIDEHIDDLEARSKLARENVLAGIWTRNEARDYLGKDKAANEFADELTVPTTQQLLDNLANGTTDPANPTTPEELPPAA